MQAIFVHQHTIVELTYSATDFFFIQAMNGRQIQQAILSFCDTEFCIEGSLPAFDGFKKSNDVGDNPLIVKQALFAFIESHKVGCLLKTGGLPEVVFWGAKRLHRKVFDQMVKYQYKGGCLLESTEAAKDAFSVQQGVSEFQVALSLSGKTEAEVLIEAGIPSLYLLNN